MNLTASFKSPGSDGPGGALGTPAPIRGFNTVSPFAGAAPGFGSAGRPPPAPVPPARRLEPELAAQAPAGSALPEADPQEEGLQGLLAICNAGSIHRSFASAESAAQGRLEVVGAAHFTVPVRRLARSVITGLRACQPPVAAEAGLGGTYFFMDSEGRRVAIIKPVDEEPLAPNNPKGFVGRALGDPGLKPTVRVGEAAMREVAAYLLDHEHFARVPATALVKVSHTIFHVAPSVAAAASAPLPPASPAGGLSAAMRSRTDSGELWTGPVGPAPKLCSMQQFMHHDCDTSEVGSSRFSVGDVHRIGILDLRLFNTDRHAGNILAVRAPRPSPPGPAAARGGGGPASGWARSRLESEAMALIPIDHGFCLPEALEPPYFEWLHWAAAMIPFSDEELAYIARLDVAADIALLRAELPSLHQGCLRVLEVSTSLLQRCAAAGLSLAEIGAVASRPLVGMEEEPVGGRLGVPAEPRSPAAPRRRRRTRQPQTLLLPMRSTHVQAYPPPVEGASPGALSPTLVDMGPQRWAAFMAALHALLDHALADGRWRRGADASAAALSCPRF
ncbi:hypothetical protein WJX81_006193 [Elliptochloris bilobata]|uniref:1-phosphatidylinositol 4-kinase n=1 Tax=Elliptochloris bilobata TaxID=381761 RepID=A0AAW1SCW5_9CHLO